MRDYLSKHHGEKFDNTFGRTSGKAVLHATSGRLVTSIYIYPQTPRARKDTISEYLGGTI